MARTRQDLSGIFRLQIEAASAEQLDGNPDYGIEFRRLIFAEQAQMVSKPFKAKLEVAA